MAYPGKYKVQCPCCKGEKQVLAFYEGHIPGVDIPTAFVDMAACAHCEGTGEIDAEVEDDQDGDASRSTRNHSLRGRMVY